MAGVVDDQAVLEGVVEFIGVGEGFAVGLLGDSGGCGGGFEAADDTADLVLPAAAGGEALFEE